MRRCLSVALLALIATTFGARGLVAEVLEVGARAPELGGGAWINSAPLTTAGLRGRVVLVDFWTFG